MLTFNAVDVETANADRSSICQVGIVQVQHGNLEGEGWQTLINSGDWFDPRHINIHGIDEERVQNAPSFPQVYTEICRRVQGSVLVSHTPFDRIAFNRASEKYGLEKLQVTWMDSVQVARRAWPHKDNGHGLESMARYLGISFRHHDALEDAKVAAQVVIEACKVSERDIQDWLQELQRRPARSSPRPRTSMKRESHADGPLSGTTVVFTGKLFTRDSRRIIKSEAADLAARAGCNVRDDITQDTTLLVVGIQNKNRPRGYNKTQKHREAEACGIEIILASDFFDLMDSIC